MENAPAPPRRRRPLLVALASLFLILAVAEGLARRYTETAANGMAAFRMPGINCALLPFTPPHNLAFRWHENADKAKFIVPDDRLGWTVARAARGEVKDSIGRPLIYESNPQGLRAATTRVYSTEIPTGKQRLVVTGDSFTFGADLPLRETWTHKLELAEASLEVMNFGVQAYGSDQAFLRWKQDAERYQATYAWLVIWPEDILRNLNRFRYFLKPRAGYVMAKPRFVLEGGKLTHVPPARPSDIVAKELADPAAQLEHEDWLLPGERVASPFDKLRLVRVLRSLSQARERQALRFAYYTDENPAANELALAIAQEFVREAEKHGMLAAVVILPQQDLLELFPEEDDLPLARMLTDAGIETINLFPDFTQRDNPLELFFPSGHFNEKGTDVVAAALVRELTRLRGGA